MRKASLIVLLAGLSPGAFAPAPLPKPEKKETGPKADLKKLQGTWTIISYKYRGKEKSPALIKGRTVVIEGNQLTYQRDGQVLTRWEIVLDSTKKPPTLDLARKAPSKIVQRGIYQFEGDTLKFCYRTGVRERPTEFVAEETGTYLYVWKRERR